MKTTRAERDEIKNAVDCAMGIGEGEVNIHLPWMRALLDDADRCAELEQEVKRLRDLLARRNELPNYCENCCGDLADPRRLEWDGDTLRCPSCKTDALEEGQGE